MIGTKIRLSLSRELREGLIKNVQIVLKGKEFELHVIYSATASAKEHEGSRAMVINPNSGNFMVIGIEGVRILLQTPIAN
ncbi:hypothetical protein [Hydrogenivirga sp.]